MKRPSRNPSKTISLRLVWLIVGFLAIGLILFFVARTTVTEELVPAQLVRSAADYRPTNCSVSEAVLNKPASVTCTMLNGGGRSGLDGTITRATIYGPANTNGIYPTQPLIVLNQSTHAIAIGAFAALRWEDAWTPSATGQYKAVFDVNATRSMPEGSNGQAFSDNRTEYVFQVTPNGGNKSPDYVVSMIGIQGCTGNQPCTVSSGEQTRFLAKIKNQGIGPASSNSINILLLDTYSDGSQDKIFTQMPMTSPLASGNSELEVWNRDVTEWVSVPGTHTVTVCADFNRAISESFSGETNNCLTKVFTVQGSEPPTPDFVPDLKIPPIDLSSCTYMTENPNGYDIVYLLKGKVDQFGGGLDSSDASGPFATILSQTFGVPGQGVMDYDYENTSRFPANKQVRSYWDLAQYRGKIKCGSFQSRFKLSSPGANWRTDSIAILSKDPSNLSLHAQQCGTSLQHPNTMCYSQKATHNSRGIAWGANNLYRELNYDLGKLNLDDPAITPPQQMRSLDLIPALNRNGNLFARWQDDMILDYMLLTLVVAR